MGDDLSDDPTEKSYSPVVGKVISRGPKLGQVQLDIHLNDAEAFELNEGDEFFVMFVNQKVINEEIFGDLDVSS